MPEETKQDAQTTETKPKEETKAKTTDEVITELQASNEKLTKMHEENQKMIIRQSAEIGDLRKKIGEEPPKTDEGKPKDEEVDIVSEIFKGKGLDDETAKFNAELVVSAGRALSARRMMGEVFDTINEDVEGGNLPGFVENRQEIMTELKTRKIQDSVRKNVKLLKDCYEIVIKKKAEAEKEKSKEKIEADREKAIAETQQAAGGGQKGSTSTEDEKYVESIRKAGAGSRDSAVFF